MKSPTIRVVDQPGTPKPAPSVSKLVSRFIKKYPPYECSIGLPIVLWHDEKSAAFYTICHMHGEQLAARADVEAVLDPDESEDYKLNREIYTDNYAYRLMEADARLGRSFEDIVVEFDESYRAKVPLKVFGGQHRIEAIRHATPEKSLCLHGVRIYFALTIDQKVDIATANNTSIAISNDLLDRMQEDLLGTELRDWFQTTGLLPPEQSFADRRNSEGVPTVRIARTLVVNFHRGLAATRNEMPDPYVCRSGPRTDSEYETVRANIDWRDKAMLKAGQEFARVHRRQREIVLGRNKDKYLEFANKCVHPSVAAAWAYVAGILQGSDALENHYSLADAEKQDPMNASALSKARLKGIDPDTYRGLGARIGATELGRMVQLFLLQATEASRRGITGKLANAAIQSFEALKATAAAEEAKKRI